MVRSAVAERELERLVPERQSEQLVAEADAEERHAAQQVAHSLDRIGQHRRVTRPVADEHGTGLQLEHGVGIPVTREHRDFDARLGEAADDRLLGAEIEQRNAWARPDELRLGHADVTVERPPVDRRLRECARLQFRDRGFADRAADDALVTDPPDERARVDAGDRDDPLLLEPGGPLGARRAHDDRLGLDATGLVAGGVDPVIADERVREAQDLGDVARVGRRLLVARARSREAGLARGDAGRSDEEPGKDGAVLEDDRGAALLHGLHLMRDFAYYARTMPTTAILGASGYAGQETLDR